METNRALEKLTLLEERITQTSERFGHLKDQYEALQRQKSVLEKELDELRSANLQLTEKIHDLKSINDENQSSFNKEEVRKRLDRVLEKFGEIQL